MESKNKIYLQWSAILIFFLAFPIILGHNYILEIFKTDKSGISYITIFLFIFAIIKNFLHINTIGNEFTFLNQISSQFNLENLPQNTKSIFISHIKNLKNIRGKSKENTISQDNMIEIINAKLSSKGYLVELLSNILVTLGLIGTIVGLIITISGLGKVMTNVGGDNSAILGGMQTSISGMGVAFYTTLVGAILGGVNLRILNSFANNKGKLLLSEIAEFSEINILPLLETKKESSEYKEWTENLIKLNNQINGFIDKFNVSINNVYNDGFNKINNNLNKFNESLTEIKSTSISYAEKVKNEFTSIDLSEINNAVNLLSNLTKQIQDWNKNNFDELKNMALKIVPELTENIKSFSNTYNAYSNKISTFNISFSDFFNKDNLNLIIAELNKLSDSFKNIPEYNNLKINEENIEPTNFESINENLSKLTLLMTKFLKFMAVTQKENKIFLEKISHNTDLKGDNNEIK